MKALALLAPFITGTCLAQIPEREIQRALIQRDQQSAEFARSVNRPALEQLHSDQLRDAGRPLSGNPDVARQLLPYERQKLSRESDSAVTFQLSPPLVNNSAPASRTARPLPGELPPLDAKK